ncbi:MAG TPA: asparagine synthase-related protein [Solirubrobacteraceae bacterium]|nr:asparagine synthase-related protein [Solirubrobacteraceae bacterium]
MSAIVALAAGVPGPEDHAWLEHAAEHSRTAGPDGTRIWMDGLCGLAHALLRTGAGEAGQPLTLDGRTWVSADVRLDAHEDLSRALRSASINMESSDAELVLRAYAAWGDRFLEHLTGDFAFALWDAERRTLLCARDQLGVAPLHYARTGNRLLVASVIDALLLHPAVSDGLDEAALVDHLATGQYREHSATAFAAIRQLPPGHALTWSAGVMKLRRYWQLDPWEPLARFRRPEEVSERFRDLLDAAVDARLTADRATVQLSGGMDSTSVAASAAATLRRRGASATALRAFTGVLGAARGDREGEFSVLVARELGLPVDVVDASALSPVEVFAEPALLTPEPTAYHATTFALDFARLPARHAPIALSGHGADTLLKFVPWYWIEWLGRGSPGRVVRAFADQMRLSRSRPRPHARSIARAIVRSRGSWDAPAPPWLRPEVTAARARHDRVRHLIPPPAGALDARALASDPLWPALFRLGDPSFTRQPVRFRYPFTDLRLVRFVRSLAPEPWLVDKRVLRDSAQGRLPEVITRRPKTALVSVPSIVPPGAHRDLHELVRQCPELDRFLDRSALMDSLASANADGAHRQRELSWALGLAYWLWHRRGITASARCGAGHVRVGER